uniref:Uncharacterized protein n=1 Tax=Avena sativa TaxID=4498 RepID=A0ACD5VAV3_AVESA
MSIPHQRPCSPAAAPPLEDENLLPEILLRLPPHPCSLPRVSAVCKRWRLLVSDPGFVRRFRRHHRRNPLPLLGFLGQGSEEFVFHPTMEPPNRVPPGRFSMLPEARFRSKILGSRHGLVLMFDQKMKEALVWDPISGGHHSLAVPPGFETSRTPIEGTMLRAMGDAHHHFQVVLVGAANQQRHTRFFACIYSSETGLWSDLISTLLPLGAYIYSIGIPAVLAGDSLYWMLGRTSCALLEIDLDRQSLAVIYLPQDIFAICNPTNFTAMPEGGGLGLLIMSHWTAYLWKLNTDCDGAASWVLGRTIELGKLLSMNLEQEGQFLMLTGFAESSNVALIYTAIGLFMVQLESLQFKKIATRSTVSWHHPFESIYAAGNSIPFTLRVLKKRLFLDSWFMECCSLPFVLSK